jgi:long-chain acyl-CoA synthetase
MIRVEAEAQLSAPGAPFEMDTVEIRGVPTKVWKHTPDTLSTILLASRAYGDRSFVVYEDERLTYGDHFAGAARFAHRLVDRFGIRPGDRVAIAMRNLPEWSVAFWGAVAAGAVVVPLNAWWSGDELAYGLADSGSRVVVVDPERAERLAEYWSALPAVEAVLAVRLPSRSTVAGAGQQGVRWDEMMDDRSSPRSEAPVPLLPEVGVGPDDDATIFYTSGTTGRSKGALGTHRNICTNPLSLLYSGALASLLAGGGAGPAGPAVSLLSVPLFHATGCHSTLVGTMLSGGTLVLMRRWDAGRALELIERERVTSFGGVPAMVMQVLDHPDFAHRDTSSVRRVSYGGAPAPPELVRRINVHFPAGVPGIGYGLTETSSVTSMNVGVDYLSKPESVGPPVPVVEVKVVDPTGATVGCGEVGELLIRGPNVVKGYWHKPDATAESFSDGWLHTGDVARLDDEGFIFIVDRAKDMLIRGGENIYCVEIEDVLYDHPAVADAAVIGIPHDILGEEVGAVVQIRPGHHVEAADLNAHVAARLAAFKVPVRIWMVKEPLPRNPGGKILKRQLRSDLLGL